MKNYFLLGLILFLGFISCKSSQNKVDTIEFWHVYSDTERSSWIAEKAVEWQNTTNSEFKIEPIYKGTYSEILNASLLAGRSKQVIPIVQLDAMTEAIDSQFFVDLDTLNLDTSDFLPAAKEYYSVNGKLTSIPFGVSSTLFYWNKDKLVAAGIDRDWQPRTFEDVLWALEQAKSKNVPGANMSFAIKSQFLQLWLSTQNAYLVNNENGQTGKATESLLTSDAIRTILTWQQTMAKNQQLLFGSKIEDGVGAWQIFFNEDAMFWQQTSADLSLAVNSIGDKFDYGVGFYLYPASVTPVGIAIGGNSIWFGKSLTEDQLTAAVSFIEFLVSKENAKEWHKLTGYVPIRISAIKELREEGWFAENPLKEIPIKQIEQQQSTHANIAVLTGASTVISDITREMQYKVIGGADIDEAMQEAKTKADAAIAEYNASF